MPARFDSIRKLAIGTAVVAVSVTAALAQDVAFVKPPLEVKSGQFVPSELMTGKNHQVQPTASNDGFVNTYSLSTEWGDVKAASDYRLRVHIEEANALKALDDMSRGGVFGDIGFNVIS